MAKTQQYIAMWCNEGLECLINVTKIEQQNIIAAIKGEPLHNIPLGVMKFRAQVNSQRHYEIYAFTSDIPEVSLRSEFEEHPQAIVDSIRRIGAKIYSDRKTAKDLIT